jgi:peptidoglycan/xylan/chitin deacetylase (PgdA/CDA1 family)
MIKGAGKAGYLVVGWGWMLWDFNWFKKRNADDLVPRLADQASSGDIIVIHDGHHEDPRSDRRYAIETVDLLIPKLREKGFEFGTICPSDQDASQRPTPDSQLPRQPGRLAAGSW